MKTITAIVKQKLFVRSLVLIFTLCSVGTLVNAQITCETAVVTSTASSIQANHGNLSSRILWYKFTPIQTGYYTTHVSTDVIVRDIDVDVYSEGCDNLKTIAESDAGSVTFYAEKGLAYLIRFNHDYQMNTVKNYHWELRSETNPAGLICEQAQSVTGPSANIAANVATKKSNTLWFKFIPSDFSNYTIRSNAGYGQTFCTIYEGDCDELIRVAYSDNEFAGNPNKTYYIRWDRQAYSDNFTWKLIKGKAVKQGEICEYPIMLSGPSAGILADHSAIGSSIWYAFTSEETEIYEIKSCNNAGYLNIYTGNCNDPEIVAYSDDLCNNAARFKAEANKIYYINCNKNSLTNYTWDLKKGKASNCLNAIQLTDTSNNILAPHADFLSGEIWYKFTAKETGNYVLFAPTTAISYIYKGDCNILDFQGAKTSIYIEKDETIYIVWLGYENYYWELRMEDDMEYISCETPSILTTVANDIPAPFFSKKTSRLWYSFTPTETGVYAISMANVGKYIFFYIYDNCESNYVFGGMIGYSADKMFFYAEEEKKYFISFEKSSLQTDITWSLNLVEKPPYVTDVDISNEILTLVAGQSISPYVTHAPANAAYISKEWVSSDPGIVSMDYSEGDCFGISPGETYVVYIVTTPNSVVKDSCLVTVTGIAVESISLAKQAISLQIGETEIIEATILPDNASNKIIIWTSSNTSVAQVELSGQITAISNGETYIVATSMDGAFADSCKVTVNMGTRIEQNTLQKIKVYPNPVSQGFIIIDNEKWKEGQNVKIFDLLGKEQKSFLLTGAHSVINISDLHSGIYFIRIRTGKDAKEAEIIKIIIEN